MIGLPVRFFVRSTRIRKVVICCLSIRVSHVFAAVLPLPLSELFFTICQISYNRKYNEMSATLKNKQNKTNKTKQKQSPSRLVVEQSIVSGW